MLLRNIIFSALLVGLIAGLILSIGQHFQVSKIIHEAEKHEVTKAAFFAAQHEKLQHTHTHEHDENTWAPEDGSERFFYTTVADILSGIGFATILISFMAGARTRRAQNYSIPQGLLWGIAGFAAVFVAPSLGLHPEIPGMEAAALEPRQMWWSITVFVTIIGIALLAFAPSWNKLGGLTIIAIPHLVGAPNITTATFTHPDPQAVIALTQLHHEFLWATSITNGIFWVILGGLSALILSKWQWHNETE